MLLGFIQVFLGLTILVVGAELLVRYAARLAFAARLSPLFVGLTVVAYGTSAPELFVSISTALRGRPELALGNVIGSNIFNICFILGVSSLVGPLSIKLQIIRFDLPIMVAVSLITYLLAIDGRLSGVDGFILLLGIAAYTWWGLRQARLESRLPSNQENEPLTNVSLAPNEKNVSPKSIAWAGFGLIAGLASLIAGGDIFVRGATSVAELFHVPPRTIGLTILAAGTSLPELATSAVAAFRGERDIAVGNVVGSNLFNLLGVLGTTCVVSGNGITIPTTFLSIDFPVMLAAAVICLPIFITGRSISRLEGVILCGSYVAYTLYLVNAG